LLLFLMLALFLFPLAVYCSILGLVNRRLQPLMVSGVWDFLGVLLATSGFLLFIGPYLLSGLFRQSLDELPYTRDSGSITGAVAEVWATWWAVWLLYYLLVLGGGAFLVWSRRTTTVIYNIDPHSFDAVLAQTAQRLGLEVTRLGNRVLLAPGGSPLTPPGGPEAALSRPALAGQASLDVESFSLTSNVSLHWRGGSPELRVEVERDLERGLAQVASPDSGAGGWLLAAAGFLFLVILMLTAIFVMATLMRGRP
jgi:hypothetical protein